jgi:hypothetical protein
MSKTGEIRRDEMCLDFDGKDMSRGKKDKVITYECHGEGGNQKWYFENGLIRHNSGACLELAPDDKRVFMDDCDIRNKNQIWQWRKRDFGNNVKQAQSNVTYS